MRFRYAALKGSAGGEFSEAERRLHLGDVVRWTLRREHRTEGSARSLVAGLDEMSRMMLGAIETTDGGGQGWVQLGAGPALADPDGSPGPLALGDHVTAVTTVTQPANLRPRFQVFSNVDNAAQLLVELGLKDTRRVQKFIDEELGRLPKGKVPIFIQDGLSNLEAIGWLACLLTTESERASGTSPPGVVLTGSDGAGWHLVPLHGLAGRKEVPEIAIPEGLDTLHFAGWSRPAPGPAVRLRDPRAVCGLLRGEAAFDRAAFQSRPSALSVLPLRLPRRVRVEGLPIHKNKPLWVVQARDLITADQRYSVELLVCPDPAVVFAPTPPKDTARPGGSYWVKVADPVQGVPGWKVPCRFERLESPAVPTLLSTIYSGRDQRGGIHLVPEAGACALIHWTGRLCEHPVLTHLTRPADDEGDREKRHVDDVRALGAAAVRLPEGREFVWDIPSLHVAASRDIQLLSRQGRLRLVREHGRVLQVGQEFVDIDPTSRS